MIDKNSKHNDEKQAGAILKPEITNVRNCKDQGARIDNGSGIVQSS
jgi:hypothetical protein